MEFKAALPRLLTKAHPLLPVSQLPRDTRKLKSDLLRTRPVSWTLLTSHSSQWDRKTAMPHFHVQILLVQVGGRTSIACNTPVAGKAWQMDFPEPAVQEAHEEVRMGLVRLLTAP